MWALWPPRLPRVPQPGLPLPVPAMMLVLALALAAGCAPRPAFRFAPADPAARIERVFVATGRDLGDLGPSFGAARAERLRFVHMDVSIPPGHRLGEIEWPRGAPDPGRDFVVTQSHVYRDAAQMIEAMHRQLPGRETLVFVHGYNNTFSDAVYRFAQIRADFGVTGPGVVFSWPSAGDPRGYVYDRDSVLYARDDFERLLTALTARPGQRVLLLAHSMGGQLVMETLRQAALSGNRRLLARLSGVVLMSPDIDPDLFRRQAAAIGPLPQPFIVFVSHADRVLSVAGLLNGRKPRLGGIERPEQLAGVEGVRVIDVTALGGQERLGHSVPLTSPAAIRLLRRMNEELRRGTATIGNFVVLKAEL
ncbi:MAG: alpha/beta hydrolase [Roseovarius sp.]